MEMSVVEKSSVMENHKNPLVVDASLDDGMDEVEQDTVQTPVDTTDAKGKTYDKRKTIAHGMMDTALVSANASQLKFIIQYYRGRDNVTMAVLVTLISLSLTIQVAVGIALIFRHKKRNKNVPEKDTTNSLNISVDDFIIMGVFLVIVLNVFISAFSTDVPAT